MLFLGHYHFAIQSRDQKRRKEGNWYNVSITPVEYCGCDGFNFSKKCWHLDLGRRIAVAIQDFINKQQKSLAA